MTANKEKHFEHRITDTKNQLSPVQFDPKSFLQNIFERRRIANFELNKQKLISAVNEVESRENSTIEEMIFNTNSLPRQSVKALQCLEIAKSMGIISRKEFEEINHTLFNATPGIFTKKMKFSFIFRAAANRFLKAYQNMKVGNI
jgi:hypothetical protein